MQLKFTFYVNLFDSILFCFFIKTANRFYTSLGKSSPHVHNRGYGLPYDVPVSERNSRSSDIKKTQEEIEMTVKRILSLVLCLILSTSLCTAFADSSTSRVAIGNDLTEAQIQDVYKTFGISRGSVTELTVSNSDERHYLSSTVDESMIGTKAISCIYIEALNEGSGLSVSTSNISWCTPDTYRNALTTAGITDANVKITAPFSVSGTAALTGIYMAYESITGKQLDETAKQVGTEELAVSSELANEIGDDDTSAIVNDLKAILDETRNMSDQELHDTITDIASDYNQALTEEQISKLIALVRDLEKLDTNALMERVNSVKNALSHMSDLQNTAQTFTEKLKNLVSAVVGFFQSLGNK